MSNYNKATNFAVKDTLTSGDPDKVVSGAEIDNEFNSIASAVTTKADKVAAATTDNFASLDANGNLKDSGASQNSIENFVQTEISDQKYKDQDALDLFNVTGSAPVYACRAWVNFNGVSLSIRDSGNVSSIADIGQGGDYQINLATAMPDANYCVTMAARTPPHGGTTESVSLFPNSNLFTSSFQIRIQDSSGNIRGKDFVFASVFR